MSSHVIHFLCVAEVEELNLVDAHQSLQFEPLHQPVRLQLVSESHFSAQSYTSGNYFWLFHRKVHSGVVWATAKNWYQSHSSLVKFRNLKRNRALVHSKENNLFSLSWLVWVSLEMQKINVCIGNDSLIVTHHHAASQGRDELVHKGHETHVRACRWCVLHSRQGGVQVNSFRGTQVKRFLSGPVREHLHLPTWNVTLTFKKTPWYP